MATAEEILNGLSVSNSEAEGHIVIGIDRKIIVPTSLKRIAVQYDHNVETVTFDCPRYWDGLDMSEMEIYINYIRSDEYADCYPVNNVTVDDNDPNIMHFDWTITRNVTEVNGPIVFLVCIKKTDEDGEETNHWNSEICKDMYISEGMENEELEALNESDLVTKLLERMSDIDDLYQQTKEIKEVKKETTLYLGNLPEQGEVDKVYIVENEDDVKQYIYKVRKEYKVENVWDGVTPASLPSTLKGTGTKNDPYQITNGTELAYVINHKRSDVASFEYSELMNDIYLNDISNPNWKDKAESWKSIDNNFCFRGEFDGQNHTIYGLYYNDPDNTTGGCALFPKITNAYNKNNPIIIKNLGVDHAYVNSGYIAGALIGDSQLSNYEVKNCWFGENIELSGVRVADISANGNGKALIENCYSLSNHSIIENSNYHEGFALGRWWGNTPPDPSMMVENNNPTIKNCYSLKSKITGDYAADMTIENCYSTVAGSKATVIAEEDMKGKHALDNMPNLVGYVDDYTYPHLTSLAEGFILVSSEIDLSDYVKNTDLDYAVKVGLTTNVDQTYNPESENAQSGKAVAEAIAKEWQVIEDIT